MNKCDTIKYNIIIPSWNTCAETMKCLHHIGENTQETFRVIVWDNDSTDDTVQQIQKFRDSNVMQEKELILLKSPQNIGYTAAINRCITHCRNRGLKCEYFVLLNTDVFLLPGWSKNIDVCMQDRSTGIVCACLLSAEDPSRICSAGDRLVPPVPCLSEEFFTLDGVIVSQYTSITTPSFVMPRQGYLPRGDFQNREFVDSACFAAVVVRPVLFEQVGLLSERYKIWHSDFEYCLRVRMMGWEICYEPSFMALHVGSRSVKSSINDSNVSAMLCDDLNKKYEMYLVSLPFLCRKFGDITFSKTF